MRETKKPELKKITQEDLNQKLAERKQACGFTIPHELDLSNYDFQGVKFPNVTLSKVNFSNSDLADLNLSGLNFTDADFTGANLISANLARADFSRAKFEKADLTYADFSEATLIGVNFIGAKLTDTKFSDVDLTGADFSGTTLTDAKFCSPPSYGDPDTVEGGATLVKTKFLNAIMRGANLMGTKTAGMQLGGADVTNAILPDEIKTFDGLKTVEEASKITKRLFTMLLTALGFSVLTILSTKDHLLLTNSVSSPLPIIQTPVPLATFYWIAPFLLSAFFIYFLLNLLHLYKLISKLPAVFPDGTPLDEKIFPWQLNTLVREHFHVLSEPKIPLFRLRKFLMVFLAWWTTPIVLFGFWLRYLPRHDPWGSGLHILWFGLVILTIIGTYIKAMRILKNDPIHEWSLKRLNQILWPFFGLLLICITVFTKTGDLNFPPRWIYIADLKIPWGQLLIADFAEQEVSTKPANWNSEKPTEGVKGAALEHANLDYADATKAFLVNAKLKGASLKHAKLSGAILVQAMLDGKADLTHAELDYARLESSNLIGAILTEVNLTGAHLTGAILSGADLTKADLTDADLFGANLRVDPGDKNVIVITPEQIRKAKNWQLAGYDRDFNEKHLKLSDGEISNVLDAFMRAKYPTLSNDEVGKLYEKEMKKYRIHYGWPTGEKTK